MVRGFTKMIAWRLCFVDPVCASIGNFPAPRRSHPKGLSTLVPTMVVGIPGLRFSALRDGEEYIRVT
jgi:hypothetical protein